MCLNNDGIYILHYGIEVLPVILTGYGYSVVISAEYQKYRSLSYLFLSTAILPTSFYDAQDPLLR